AQVTAARASVKLYVGDFRSRADSVGVTLEEYPQRRQEEDLDVERQRPVLDVVSVVKRAITDGRGTAQVIDLRPSCEARPHLLPLQVARHRRAVLLVEMGGLRARADEAHVAFDDVDELRQLVEARAAEEPTQRGCA